MADSIGEKGISKNYPVSSDTGVEEDQYHKGRKISLEAEKGSLVPKRKKQGC